MEDLTLSLTLYFSLPLTFKSNKYITCIIPHVVYNLADVTKLKPRARQCSERWFYEVLYKHTLPKDGEKGEVCMDSIN